MIFFSQKIRLDFSFKFSPSEMGSEKRDPLEARYITNKRQQQTLFLLGIREHQPIYAPSKHTTSEHRRCNVAATTLFRRSSSYVVTTLMGRCVFAGEWTLLPQFFG